MKKTIGLCMTLLLAACGPAAKTVGVQVTNVDLRIRQAESLVAKGHYTAFKRAVDLYGGLYDVSSLRQRIAAPYIQACLLLAMREKDLGIDNPGAARTAERLVQENASLSAMKPYLVMISRLPLRTKGVIKDIDTAGWDAAGAARLAAAREEVVRRSASNEFAACVQTAWSCSFGGSGVLVPQAADPGAYLKLFPSSLLLKYEAATCGDERAELLEEILSLEPDFAEAHYHLGEAALKRGKLLEAEGHLLKASEAIPESPQPSILLGGIYFATEEFDKSLFFYDKTLQITPEYRDALLGKAICLSYMGRHDEAMRELNRILDLGFWLIGEGHYWLAWNLHNLKRDPEAILHIDEAKSRLPTNSEVFSLAGTIALDQSKLGRAEKDFQESLQYNAANTEALFGLGTVASMQKRWEDAGRFYGEAGRAFESGEAALRRKIEEINRSALSGERKARLVRSREAQLERTRLSEATAYYDAAAAYLNAGAKDKALACAAKAAGHPALKDKVEELLRSIKN